MSNPGTKLERYTGMRIPVSWPEPELSTDGRLCQVCQALCEMFRYLQARDELGSHINGGSRFTHQPSVETSASQKCRLCALILRVLKSGERGQLWFQEGYCPLPEGPILIHCDWLKRIDDHTQIEVRIDEHRSDLQGSVQSTPTPGVFFDGNGTLTKVS